MVVGIGVFKQNAISMGEADRSGMASLHYGCGEDSRRDRTLSYVYRERDLFLINTNATAEGSTYRSPS